MEDFGGRKGISYGEITKFKSKMEIKAQRTKDNQSLGYLWIVKLEWTRILGNKSSGAKEDSFVKAVSVGVREELGISQVH